MTLDGLAARSVAVIREHQATSGACLAAPFPALYRNAWLRDGAFVADAMSRAGEREGAEAFFSWCARGVEVRGEVMGAGEIVDGRFTVDGREVGGEWSASGLVVGRGVHRHPEDELYAVGLWQVLAGFLGWKYALSRRSDEARAQLDWIASAADGDGRLPEQVGAHLPTPQKRAEWVERWGRPASPLLWSRALFLTLALELGALGLESAA